MSTCVLRIHTSEYLYIYIYKHKSTRRPKYIMYTLQCRQVDKTTQQDVMKKLTSCKAREQVGL